MKSNTTGIYCCIVIGLIIAGFFACKKDPGEIINAQPSSAAYRVSECSMHDISLECENVLHFASAEIFESTLKCLEEEYDKYNDSIQSVYSSLNDDAFNDTLEALGISEEQSLENFELSVGYISLRHSLRAAEDTWLDNSTLVDANDPVDNCPIGDDPVMSTLFNQSGEIMIGDTIYKYLADGSLIAVTNGNCLTLDSLRNDLIKEENSPNVRNLTFNSDTLDCQTQKHASGRISYTGGKQYKWRIAIHTAYFGSTAKASTRSFKQKSNGHWKRFKTHIGAQVYGTLWNTICTENDSTSKTKIKSRRSKIVARRFGINRIYKTKTGRLHSAHECSSTSVNSQHDLTW